MAICLDYQAVYRSKQSVYLSLPLQVLAALLLLLTLVCKIWLSVQVTSLGYRVAKERQHTIELDMARREAELQLSVLLRPDNLAQAAADRLNLKPLDPKQARRVNLRR